MDLAEFGKKGMLTVPAETSGVLWNQTEATSAWKKINLGIVQISWFPVVYVAWEAHLSRELQSPVLEAIQSR